MNKYKLFSKMWFLALLLVAFVTGCASNGTEVDPNALVSISVTPPLASIPVTGTQQYTVIAIYRNGSSSDVTASSIWTSVNVPGGGATVATVSSTAPTKGLATGKVIGKSAITATYLGNSATVSLTVNAATATKFEVKPTTFSIPVTGTQQFTAIETFSDGTSFDRTTASTWTAPGTVGGVAVATMSLNGLGGGVATGKVVGSTPVTATYAASPLSPASATLNVNAATSVTFKVTPALATMPITGTQQYTATETFSDGSTIDRTAASTWTAENVPVGGAAVATLSTNGVGGGVATGKVVGQAIITATFGAMSNSATLNVNAATAVSFKVTPALALIAVTGTQKYTAVETFSDGTSFDRTAVSTWSAPGTVAGVSVATIDSAGIATGKVAGSTLVTATYAASPLSPASATLNVGTATTLSFKVIPATATISINGGSQQFAAIETFSDGSTADRTLLSTWSSLDLSGGPGVSTIGLNSGIATGAVLGQSTITATYVVGGVTQTASAVLTVTAPSPGAAGTGVNLGTAATYGIIAQLSITSSSVLSHIYGDVALTAGVASKVTGPGLNATGVAPNLTSTGVTTSDGVTPGIVIATDNGNSALLPKLQSDLNAAYIDLSTRQAPTVYAAGAYELSGKLIIPGIYRVGAMAASDTFALSNDFGPVVLDAKGNPDAIFIFQAGAITTTTGSVVLQGGAQAKNIFWVVTSDAVIGNGTSTFFQGTVVAANTITVAVNTNVQGRMLSGALGVGGAITNSGVITVPK